MNKEFNERGTKLDLVYEDKYHLHLGYYENNCDYESIAYKRQSEDVWDIFFDFEQYGLKNSTKENELTLEGIGTRIFSIHDKELNYDIGVQKFKKWLFRNKII
ncbi:DUF3986 family protein [Fictibacillus nanhaiensis]|uniref:DUF3986 family protein n=1 Tax=Fictibacillus nanhaiensis TaxID=742169 RepID=UPI00203CE084|nr:DUF3986 family protein [Fictibacillus nanhaiensis]MCM3732731.1 DUF3986 family protein [Fictibacillus nanhaiensis]